MASPLGLTFDIKSTGIPSITGKNKSYKVVNSKVVKSLFGGGQFSPFPSGINTETGSVTGMKSASDVHKDEIYDLSVTKIVEYCNQHKAMKLDYADFAYLKNIGVFPNNRLMIARRFAAGVSNDLTAISSTPLSTLISWVPEGEDFISVSYNEKWEQSESSFEEVLNDIGKDSTPADSDNGTKIGTFMAGGDGLLTLPGFMEGIQYEVLNKMGLSSAGIGNSPLGNPNLIRDARRRSTIDPKQNGSGLSCKFSIKMVVEYEQKFINGVDPTLVYMDIIQNALTFGTSDSSFQFSTAFATGTSKIIKGLISGDFKEIAQVLTKFVTSLTEAIKETGQKLVDAIVEGMDSKDSKDEPNSKLIYDAISSAFASTYGHVVSKYKVRLLGIVNALTGSPSTPWHITIGNPQKPMFSSGDMLVENVQLTMGKSLSFNDLPSYIKIEFTLSNARDLGAQEIFNRFNTGKGRSYVRLRKSYVELSDSTFEDANTQNINKDDKSKNKQVPDDYLVNWEDDTKGKDWS